MKSVLKGVLIVLAGIATLALYGILENRFPCFNIGTYAVIIIILVIAFFSRKK